jgi:hypothetical protein
MKLDEVNKIKNITEENEVNEYLAKGYRILKILSTKSSSEFSDEIKPTFILGLKREDGE